MKNDYQQIGKRIRFLRRQEEFTQAQLAEKTGLSDNYVGLIERGIRYPSLETLGQIADALKVRMGEFFAGDDSGSKSKNQIIKEINRFLAKRKDKDAHFLLAICKIIGEQNHLPHS